jgi:glutaconate CoA-transferase subunit B
MNASTRDELMTIAAARLLWNRCVCFVGIGLPSAACNLARLTHAPEIVLIYESGTIGTRPEVLPLPEIFSHYLQAGRVDVGFLGAAQIDKHGNLNSTVIGPYDSPKTRLPGAGGAQEIASHAKQTFVMLSATTRSFVERLDFRTSAGFLEGNGARARSGARGGGPRAVITDFGMLTPHPQTEELQLTALFPGATVDEARSKVGWPLAIADRIDEIAPPTTLELETLRALNARTKAAHARAVEIPL